MSSYAVICHRRCRSLCHRRCRYSRRRRRRRC